MKTVRTVKLPLERTSQADKLLQNPPHGAEKNMLSLANFLYKKSQLNELQKS